MSSQRATGPRLLAGSWMAALGALLLLAGCGSSKRSEFEPQTEDGAGGSDNVPNVPGDAGSGGTDTTDPPDPPPPPPPPCTQGIPATSQIPRLTNEQYEHTVRDLLGITTIASLGARPSELLAPDAVNSDITEIAWNAYQVVGEAIAVQVIADPNLRGRFLACESGSDTAACLHDSIVAFGRRAFRRPLTEAEVTRFEAIAARGAEITETGSMEQIAEVLLQTFLVSPSFLQRSEISYASDGMGHYALSSFEIASRLSYMLWGSTPDETLDRAADANELTTNEQILEQAGRMLTDPRARDVIASFHRFYLQAGPGSRWDSVERNPKLFPNFTSGAAAVLWAETEQFFRTVVFDQGGSFQDLFTSTVGFVNADTAPLYGLDPAGFGSELQEVSLDAAERPGFLTRIGFLSAYSGYERTSPVQRGTFIVTRVLGMELGEHPADVPPPPVQEFSTNREFTTAVTAGSACAGCHIYVNGPGFALEAFDAAGQWQTQEASTGVPIDTAADVFIDDQTITVSGPAELTQELARSSQAQRTYATSWMTYAYEREPGASDVCTLDTLADKLRQGDYSVLDLMADLTQADSFRSRVREEP